MWRVRLDNMDKEQKQKAVEHMKENNPEFLEFYKLWGNAFKGSEKYYEGD